MGSTRIVKGIMRFRQTPCLTPCFNRQSEILHFTPVTQFMKVRHKTRGFNYKVLPSTPMPVRPTEETENLIKHSIWLTETHGPPRCSIEEAITMHMEYADPSMLNNMEGYIYADLKCNMSTKKKTKFMRSVRGLLEYPNHFDYGPPKKIAVFCFTPEDMAIAKEYGALYCGGEELIREFSAGLVSKDAIADLDFILATPDNLTALGGLRSTLRDRVPKLQTNTLHADLHYLLDKYTNGVIYNVTKPSEERGKAQVPIGQMSQGLVSLVENFEYMVDHLSALKGKGKNIAPFIEAVTLIAPPSHEQFIIKVEDHVKGHEVKEIEEDTQEELPEDIEDEAVQASR